MNANDLADRLEEFYTGTHITKAAETLRKQQEEIDYWKEKFEKAMALSDQVKYLEAQVYGGTTK
jgi:hypothetical protein